MEVKKGYLLCTDHMMQMTICPKCHEAALAEERREEREACLKIVEEVIEFYKKDKRGALSRMVGILVRIRAREEGE